jgi:hypothetical protein
MKIAVMQPYFLPYIGYISLMKCVDRWVFLDRVQMIKRGWINRNRVLKQHDGWYYINVPIKKYSHKDLIMDICIRNDEPWKEKIIAKLSHYKKRAPYYHQTIHLLETAFEEKFDCITRQNAHLLKHIASYLGFEFEYDILSEMDINLKSVKQPDEWALEVCKDLGADHYINPIKGKLFFDKEKYEEAGIHINFLNKNMKSYDQKLPNGAFIGGLSIVDVVMFLSPKEVMKRLDDYVLE